MKNLNELVRPNILSLSKYSTARDEYLGNGIGIFLDANESPYENGYNRYPDPHQKNFKKIVSEIKGVPSEQIFAGNGSDEAIDLVFRVFCEPGKDNVVAIAPSYGMYRVAAAMNDVQYREVLLEEDFSLDTEKLLGAADRFTKAVFICSPNNPTGNAFPLRQIECVLEKFDGIVVVDEAYSDFSDKGSCAELLNRYPNLIVLQTLSKAWGLAGLRLGLAFSSREIISIFSKVKYPYNINTAALKIAGTLICRDSFRTEVAEIVEQRKMLQDKLPECSCVRKVYPSDANFLLVEFDDPGKIYTELLCGGIIVRDRSMMPLCNGCLRITVGTPVENMRLLKILKRISGQEDNAEEKNVKIEERFAEVHRKTSETDVCVSISFDREGKSSIDTGLHFLDHMLWQLPHHGGVVLNVKATGDLAVDQHHTVEDIAIVLGEVIDKALGQKLGIGRYGFVLPMDDCDAAVLIDFGGRTDFRWAVEFSRATIGDVPSEMFRHFFMSLCCSARCNLHIKASGENDHHKIEAVFKAFARALRMAVARTSFPYELPSSKGVL